MDPLILLLLLLLSTIPLLLLLLLATVVNVSADPPVGVNMTVHPRSTVWSVGDRVEVLWDDTHTWWVGTIISVEDLDDSDDSDDSDQVHHDYDDEKT